MKYRILGKTDLNVSALCLGTMTWGEQNSEAQAHEQMDYAHSQGINFFDTAEMYPVPPKADTQGRTEAYIGTWFEQSGKRDKVILASKVVGRGDFTYLRGEETRLNAKHMSQALENSLKRLKTDYIDLYQLHWPDRKTNFFGQLGYKHQVDNDISLEETLGVLDGFVKAGKVRHIGLSNETPWGVMHCLQLAETRGLPRVQTIQNPYSLLNRSYEIGLAEISIREKCSLLAYSPLAFGMLTGKYLNGARPPGTRISLYSRFQRYLNPQAQAATEKYVALAKKHKLSPAQMALSFVTNQPFVTSNIIGATSMEQLKENIESAQLNLSDEILNELEAIQTLIPNPAP